MGAGSKGSDVISMGKSTQEEPIDTQSQGLTLQGRQQGIDDKVEKGGLTTC